MRNALIINSNGFTPCSHPCGSLGKLVKKAGLFDAIHETSVDSPNIENKPAPDLILPRLFIDDWTSKRLKAAKRLWASAKTFALLCGRNNRHNKEIHPALIDVDEFLVCPYDESELLIRLTRLFKQLPAEDNAERDLVVGESPQFRQAMHKVTLLAKSKAAVVISGETGSGKELLARAIHYQSARKAKPFVPVNCGALPDELFENELFGHFKGAYTSASSAEKGLIAEAEGGTLFLDEVDTLSQAAQVKLLRVLQSGEYRPLGSSRSAVADVRIIAACNSDLTRLVEQKLFREDLHYRLNVLSLLIPPLRDRGADVIRLASHFLSVYAREHGRAIPKLSDAALQMFLQYSWPGNVRELESVIQRAIVLQGSEILQPEDFSLPKAEQQTTAAAFQKGKSQAIGNFERNFIGRLLAAHGGNVSRAAKAAGKDRRSFQRLINKHGLDRQAFKTAG
ncbi:MAG TPA: sigma 54-interacting transcriptional regulator [Pyrinomonadaceae bacterium]